MSQAAVNRRIRLLLLMLALAFAGTLARTVWLQGVRAEPLSQMAASQQRQTVEIPAPRGTIFDRNGVQLALGEQATTVYADPTQVVNPRAVAAVAEKTLGVDADSLYPQLLDRKRSFVYVARKAEPRRAAALARHGFAGVGFYPEERRRYPLGSVASHVLGYAGQDNTGLAGLELWLDRSLRGRPGAETVVRDALGRVVDVVSATEERPGRNVFLTLDRRIQANAEDVLRRTVRRWGATAATAVVLDPRTGEILAMAVAPGFDANRFAQTAPHVQRNRAVSDTYEPGSTFKLITVAAAISEGLVTPQTPFWLPGSIRVADRVINEHDPRGTQRMTVAEILSQSSNVGAVTLALKLGKERLHEWVRRFGFGVPTGIDYPGEVPGLVLPPEHWSGSTIGNLPIGQGIGVTPIQMAVAYATIANGGVAAEPHLVARARPKTHRVVSPQAASQLASMLAGVVSDGTGTAAAIPGYRVAGKTGTAAKPLPNGRGYSTSAYVASFVGFVPATRPRLVISVMVDEPRNAIWGGVVAAPAFQEIARFALQYLEIPPDGDTSPR